MKICLLAMFAVSSVVAAASAQRILTVPGQYATIQAAIIAANVGDTVLVAPGTYRENLHYLGKRIAVRSSGGARLTVLDGRGFGSTVTIDAAGAALEGFTVTNGTGTATSVSRTVCYMPAFCRARTVQVVDVEGGGILARASGVLIHDNIVRGNSCARATGSSLGGGIFAGKNAVIQRNRVESNTLTPSPTLYVCTPVICPMIGTYMPNTGSGIFAGAGSVISDNVVESNESGHTNSGMGGAIDVRGALLVNNVVARNQASGVTSHLGLSSSWITLTNCTIVRNQGIGVDNSFLVNITNCIIRDNGTPVRSTSSITYSNVDTALPGVGTINAPAQLVDDMRGDYHLKWNSPCRDVGTNSAAGIQATDNEGDPRTSSGTADIGADEFHAHLYVTGRPSPGGVADVKVVGRPGSQVFLGYSARSMLLNPPLVIAGVGSLYLPLPRFVVSLGKMPSSGVILFTIKLPGSLPTPIRVPVQALVGTTLTNPVLYLVN